MNIANEGGRNCSMSPTIDFIHPASSISRIKPEFPGLSSQASSMIASIAGPTTVKVTLLNQTMEVLDNIEHKKANFGRQRVSKKNLVKTPSNSGRSSKLLQPLHIAGVHGKTHLEVSESMASLVVDSSFQTEDQKTGICHMLFRKILKKDSTTKLKSLQELSELIERNDVSNFNLVMCHWIDVYKCIANDSDPKVREYAQIVQGNIVSKGGKSIAPYLKKLVPVWIVSQFDLSTAAANYAKLSFNSFPVHRHKDVLVYCHLEIISYISENLSVEKVDPLNYERFVSSNLRAYSFLLKTIAHEKLLGSTAHRNLLCSESFWRLPGLDLIMVKLAWYECLSSLLSCMPEFLISHEKKIVETVFRNIAETHPIVSTQIWGCVLLIQTSIKEWYRLVNFTEDVFPTISILLTNGCQKNASNILPCYLVFISKLDENYIDSLSLTAFYNENLNVMQKYIKSNDRKNQSDIAAYSRSYFECIRLAMEKSITNKNELEALYCTRSLFDHYIKDIIVWLVTTNNEITSKLCLEVSNLILYCNDKKKPCQIYSKLNESFWKFMLEPVKWFENQDITFKLGNYLDILLEIGNLTQNSYSNQLNSSTDSVALNKKYEVDYNTIYKELRNICFILARVILNRVIKEEDIQTITHLNILRRISDDNTFYMKISQETEMSSFIYLLDKGLVSELFVNTVLEFLHVNNQGKKLEYIRKILMIPNQHIQQWTLEHLLSYPLCIEPEIREFLLQSSIADIIIRIAKDSIFNGCTEKLKLLRKCFCKELENEILIAGDAAVEIMNIMLHPEQKVITSDSFNDFGKVIAYMTPFLFSKNIFTSELFINLFKYITSKNNDLEESTLQQIIDCLHDGVVSGALKIDEKLIKHCSSLAYSKLTDECCSLNDIDFIAKCIFKIFSSNEKCTLNNTNSFKKTVIIIESLFSEIMNQNLKKIENIYAYHSCIEGKFTPNCLKTLELPSDKEIICLLRICCLNVKLVYLSSQIEDSLITQSNITSERSEDIVNRWPEIFWEQLFIGMKAVLIGSSTCFPDTIKKEIVSNVICEVKCTIHAILDFFSEHNRLFMENLIVLKANSQAGINSKLLIFTNECAYDKLFSKIYDLNEVTRLNFLQILVDMLPVRAAQINMDWFGYNVDVTIRVAAARAYIQNYFSARNNTTSDKVIIQICLDLLLELAEMREQSENSSNHESNLDNVIMLAEIVKFTDDVLEKFFTSLSYRHWDFVRISLSSWILKLSKLTVNLPVTIFIASVYKLHNTMHRLLAEVDHNMSTTLLKYQINEWENLFSKDINIILFKHFYSLLSEYGNTFKAPDVFYKTICSYAEDLDYDVILNSCQKGIYVNLEDCLKFILDCITQKHLFRITGVTIFRKMVQQLIEMDNCDTEKRSIDIEKNDGKWHLLSKMLSHITMYDEIIDEYIKNNSLKNNESNGLIEEKIIGYLLLWDSIIFAASLATAELKSWYAQWITSNQLEDRILLFITRSMPIEVLNNCESKNIPCELFRKLEWIQIKENNASFQRFVCHIYTQILQNFPAVVRKWWNRCDSRQRIFVDKFTTNCVSRYICEDELLAIATSRHKHEHMQITVHTSTREIIAKYSIDDTKLELSITLSRNHPLGAPKIETKKQIGGRLQSRAVVRQLTIFLSHQNGSLFDVLTLWKKCLDKKFEGIEECYICFSVIHQETCQLPKLTCKTCRKKFHASCLYKWFTASSKSTCPICRNIF